MSRIFRLVAMAVLSASLIGTSQDDLPKRMQAKVLVGYQGWFGCPGDGSPQNNWSHWSRGIPSPENLTIDLYPDVTELSGHPLCALPNMTIKGRQAYVFSSFARETVEKHFEWMKTYGIDGVLVSARTAFVPAGNYADLYGRHFYSGSKTAVRVCIANDSLNGTKLPAGELIWQVKSGSAVLVTGRFVTSPIEYYSNLWSEFVLYIPNEIPAPRLDATLTLSLEVNGIVQSKNSYDVTIATRSWTEEGLKHPIAIYSAKNTMQVATLPLSGRELTSSTTPDRKRL